MRAYINGMGMVCASGPTLGEFRAELEAGGPREDRHEFLVDLKRADKARLKNLRRADKLSKMSVLSAREALEDAGLYAPQSGVEAGVILATGLGPHTTTFSFLDDILEYGDAGVSPTIFSNSVHNAAASYIASDCGLIGPTLTLTEFMFSFHEALALALSWLEEGRVPRVLLGAADIHGEVLGHVAGRMLDGKAGYSPAEGSAFFMIEPAPREAYSAITRAETGMDILPSARELLLIDRDGMIKTAGAYDGLIDEGRAGGAKTGSYTHLYGSMMTGSAFNMAAAALLIKGGSHESAEVLRLDCSGRRGIIGLSRD